MDLEGLLSKNGFRLELKVSRSFSLLSCKSWGSTILSWIAQVSSEIGILLDEKDVATLLYLVEERLGEGSYFINIVFR